MIFEKDFDSLGYTDIVGYCGKDITEEMIDACLVLEQKFYNKSQSIASDKMKQIIMKFNQMCFVFIDKVKNAIVGYSFWLPIKTSVINESIQNKTSILTFEPDDFTPYKEKNINLFLSSEAYVVGYDINKLHEAIEDVFARRILDLAYIGTTIKYIALESVCKFDEEFLVKRLNLNKSVKKDKSTFYYGEYNPSTTYKSEKFLDEIRKYYQKLAN